MFDTNHDGTLNASDSSWNDFRIMVTNADGTTTLETLAQAGVTSINLTRTPTARRSRTAPSIDGETTFTRSNGTHGHGGDGDLRLWRHRLHRAADA